MALAYKGLDSENSIVPRLEKLKCIEMTMGSLKSVLCHLSMVLVVKLSRGMARQDDAEKC